MDDIDTTSYPGMMSEPITIPNIKDDETRFSDDEMMQSDDDTCDVRKVMGNGTCQCVGSSEDAGYDSPKLPRPSNDFSNVMVKFHPNIINMASSCPTYRSSPTSPLFASHKSDSSIEIEQLQSALFPNTERRRPRRNVHFDEATITVTAELGESAARFRSRWRQRHRLSISPLIKFGSKNIAIQHDDELATKENILRNATPTSGSPNRGKSIFDICSYTPYGRYT